MTTPLVILAADIGGTHARFMLASGDAGRFAVLDEATVAVAEHQSVEAACAAFLARTSHPPVNRACLAVAGPVEGGRAKLTNAAWRIDADSIAAHFAIDDVVVCNDFEAAGHGLDALDTSACLPLQGVAARGFTEAPRLLIGAGTGLGVAYVLAEGARSRIVAGEGGHAGFAPADDEQFELLQFLRPSLGRVTAEHVLSGAGLVRLYAFACRGAATLPADVHAEGAAAVARRFANGEPAARSALRLFASIFGVVAGDHALAILATGGVYLAGGIVPRFLDVFRDGGFVAAFTAKGSHATLMQRMPVCIVRDDRLGLKGATRRALTRPA